MRSSRSFTAIDTHTEGMPTRVVTSGFGTLPGSTMMERSLHVGSELDHLRRLLMFEPRGHAAMSGAILQPPIRPDADLGVVYIEVTGCLPMCGHGTIGVVTAAIENGLVTVEEPVTRVRLDTPAGLVVATAAVLDGQATSVTLENVASFVLVEDASIQVDGFGDVTCDVAFGGNFYVIVDAGQLDLTIEPHREQDLIDAGMAVVRAADAQLDLVHPADPSIRGTHHALLTSPPEQGSGHGTVVISPGYLDRSPCGTGTSARMAQLWTRSQLSLNEPFVHTSIIGSSFTGTLVHETEVEGIAAVIPTITGRAWVTGLATYLLDPTDPFQSGFQLGARQ